MLGTMQNLHVLTADEVHKLTVFKWTYHAEQITDENKTGARTLVFLKYLVKTNRNPELYEGES